jgi:glucose-6-phosphate isomerase
MFGTLPFPSFSAADTASVRSHVTGRSGTVAETISEMRTAKARLLSTLHDRPEESENFVVTAGDGGQFRIMIGDKDK